MGVLEPTASYFPKHPDLFLLILFIVGILFPIGALFYVADIIPGYMILRWDLQGLL